MKILEINGTQRIEKPQYLTYNNSFNEAFTLPASQIKQLVDPIFSLITANCPKINTQRPEEL